MRFVPACLSFSVPFDPVGFRNQQSLFHTGRHLNRRSQVERQPSQCLEEGEGDRVDCQGPKDWETDSASRLVCTQRNGTIAVACYRHRFSVVQEHRIRFPSQDQLEWTKLQRQNSNDNREESSRGSHRIVQRKIRRFGCQEVLSKAERGRELSPHVRPRTP